MTRLVRLLPALAALGCRSPTEITVHLSTNASCGDVAAGGTALYVGHEGAPTKQAARTTECAGGTVGSFVFYPSGDRSERVTVEAIMGLGKSPDECSTASPDRCIFARRTLRYVPHTPLDLPMEMNTECAGLACDSSSTCILGVCKPSDVNAPGFCDESCSDGGVEAGRPDATITDATAPDASPGDGGVLDAGFDGSVSTCVPALLASGAKLNATGNVFLTADQVFWADGVRVNHVLKAGGLVTSFDTTGGAPVNPTKVAVDATNLYYALPGVGGFLAPISGTSGAGIQVVSENVTHVTADSSAAYFAGLQGIYIVTRSAPQLLPLQGVTDISTDGALVAWGEGVGSFQIRGGTVPLTGSTTPITFVSGRGGASTLVAVSAPGAYWVEEPSASRSDIFYSVPGRAGIPPSFATEPSSIDALAVDADYVYWLYESPLTIAKAPKTDGSQKTIVSLQPMYPAMAVDKDCVYFIANDGLRKAPK